MPASVNVSVASSLTIQGDGAVASIEAVAGAQLGGQLDRSAHALLSLTQAAHLADEAIEPSEEEPVSLAELRERALLDGVR